MSKILIVGAGQAGLQLALGLVQDGHDVTVVSNRTAEDIRGGKVMSSQCMFHDALQHERDLGLDFWEDECPDIEGVSFASAQRADFTAYLQQHNGSIPDLVRNLTSLSEKFSRKGGALSAGN